MARYLCSKLESRLLSACNFQYQSEYLNTDFTYNIASGTTETQSAAVATGLEKVCFQANRATV